MVRRTQLVVDPALQEVLIDRVVERERELREAASKRRPIGLRVFIEIRPHRRIDRHCDRPPGVRRIRKDAQARVVVWHDGGNRLPETLAERFVAQKEEGPILPQGAAKGAPELVAREIRLLAAIEVVARIQGIVAVVLERAA